MTLASEVTKKSYAGDDSTVAFPTTFVFWDNADIEVILKVDATAVETTWVEGTQYDLSGGDGAVGTVTVKTTPTDYTPATGETLLIRSARSDTQGDSLPLGGPFPSTVVEKAIDQLARLIQQKAEALGRALKFPKTTTLLDIELPLPVANRSLKWNGTADGLENTDSDLDAVEAAAAASAAAAAASETAAGLSETAAASSESLAAEWAENPEDTAITGSPGQYSALHWAAKSAASSGLLFVNKVIEIGEWDMNVSVAGSASVSIPHLLTNTKIRGVSVMIRNDSGFLYELRGKDASADGYISEINISDVDLNVVTGGAFDTANFNALAGFNRGWITILYEP